MHNDVSLFKFGMYVWYLYLPNFRTTAKRLFELIRICCECFQISFYQTDNESIDLVFLSAN